MFGTVRVTCGSRSRFLGQARPSAVFTTGRPFWTSTHTGAPCTVPSGRRVATWQKFLPFKSSSARPSIVALIAPTLSHDLYWTATTIGPLGRSCHEATGAVRAGRLSEPGACYWRLRLAVGLA